MLHEDCYGFMKYFYATLVLLSVKIKLSVIITVLLIMSPQTASLVMLLVYYLLT